MGGDDGWFEWVVLMVVLMGGVDGGVDGWFGWVVLTPIHTSK